MVVVDEDDDDEEDEDDVASLCLAPRALCPFLVWLNENMVLVAYLRAEL